MSSKQRSTKLRFSYIKDIKYSEKVQFQEALKE